MTVLALHAGDLYVRAAHTGRFDAPAAVEDAIEPSRFVTPSIAALDVGGALLGYSALLAGAIPRHERVTWRYRRAALQDRSVVAVDARQRGLTSEAFLALATARLAADARGYAAETPDLALVVPDELNPATRNRIAASIAQCVQRPVRIIGEGAALFAACDAAKGTWLVASIDDDALRLRVVAKSDDGLASLDADAIEQAGVRAVRERWLAEWNGQVAALVPGAQGFEEGDSYEFERLWQDICDALDGGTSDASRTLTWPLLRRSTVITLCVQTAPLLRALQETFAGVGERARGLLGATVPDGLIVVGAPAFRRIVLEHLQTQLAIPSARCREVGTDAYARGGAVLAALREEGVAADMAEAPHALGVVGLGEEGAPTVRTLVQPGQALPAVAQFTVVADPGVQKDVAVTLTRSHEATDVAYRYHFGPLLGSGVQRIGIAVEWRRDGTLTVRAIDRGTGAPLPCTQRLELSAGVPLVAVEDLRST